MSWSNPLSRLARRHSAAASADQGPSLPPALARRVHRMCAALGTPANTDASGWMAEQAAMSVYAAETPAGQSVVQLYAGDGRATAALAAGTEFARRPAMWAIDTFASTEAGAGSLKRNLTTVGLDGHAVAVTAGPVMAGWGVGWFAGGFVGVGCQCGCGVLHECLHRVVASLGRRIACDFSRSD